MLLVIPHLWNLSFSLPFCIGRGKSCILIDAQPEAGCHGGRVVVGGLIYDLEVAKAPSNLDNRASLSSKSMRFPNQLPPARQFCPLRLPTTTYAMSTIIHGATATIPRSAQTTCFKKRSYEYHCIEGIKCIRPVIDAMQQRIDSTNLTQNDGCTPASAISNSIRLEFDNRKLFSTSCDKCGWKSHRKMSWSRLLS